MNNDFDDFDDFDDEDDLVEELAALETEKQELLAEQALLIEEIKRLYAAREDQLLDGFNKGILSSQDLSLCMSEVMRERKIWEAEWAKNTPHEKK